MLKLNSFKLFLISISLVSIISGETALVIPAFSLNELVKISKLNELPVYKDSINKKNESEFISEEISIKELDYFYTNSISRASKTMSKCRQINQNSKKTGTNN